MSKTIRHCLAAAALAGGMAFAGAAQAQTAASPEMPSRAPMTMPGQAVNPNADIATGTVSPRQPQSDQIRGPVEDSMGRTRPGNPSPSVR
ncbi:hypothetical protein [Methylobacterium oryzihabitans]|uniref:Serine/threonine protein kinase n=1 Tax=Methylobacterium oryzihabitans TaxID=2499852 RepID=A0A3S2VQX7_9HYPH|nr:hypothetical protein [Methylobacterium oryzihabitans]RVU15072.1 hypothetical protein EOE48_20955 [Methylobacterium oryzihabitans]